MSIICSCCDSEYLKVLLCSKLSKLHPNVPVEIVSNTDVRLAGKKAGVVYIKPDNDCVESSNEICKYLLPTADDKSELLNTWVLWQQSNIYSQLNAFISKKDESEANLKSSLSYLNDSLQNQPYILGDTLSVGDVIIFCSLYPLLSDNNEHIVQLLKPYSNVLTWYGNICKTPEFIECSKLIESGLSMISKANNEDDDVINKLSDEAVGIWVRNDMDGVARSQPIQRIRPVLPVAGARNILITSALPYVNNVPHLGNIIGCVLSADVFSRFCRLNNWNVLFICGTDEYGTATETKALDEGLTPQQICDKYFKIHSEIYNWFNIDFDLFGRTTTENQKEVVQKLFKDCYDNGYTLTQVMDQLLCETCDRYLADRFVEGICPKCKYPDARGDQCDGCGQLINAVELIEPKCKQCRNTPVVRQSQQLFLDLPQIESKLAEWVESKCNGWTHNAKVITKAWLKEGLKPRCITRDLKWGIPVPLEGFESKVFYVWFDAPIGYMSMTKTYSEKGWLSWWKPDESSDTNVTLYQFMAKDNVPFHSIMFPATLFACKQPYTTVSHLMATEYLNYEDGKFSKSRGVGVFGTDAKDTGIDSDIYRFYLLYVRPESNDSTFSWNDLAAKNNTDLLNNLGNFVNRALMFSCKFFNSTIPEIKITDEEKQLISIITKELYYYTRVVESGQLREGIKYILNISRHGNQYIQANQPWVLIKGTDEQKVRAGTVTGFACQMVCLLTVLLHPYMPATSDILKKQINFPEKHFVLENKFLPYLETGHKIGQVAPLFAKIETSKIEELKKKYAGKQQTNTAPTMTSEQLQEAIDKQGQLVRSLKESGKSKEEWQPEVNKLLELKKQLTAAASAKQPSHSVEELEKLVAEQGEKVRSLKASGKEKSVIQEEINLLLDFKTKLSIAKGDPQTESASGKNKKKKK